MDDLPTLRVDIASCLGALDQRLSNQARTAIETAERLVRRDQLPPRRRKALVSMPNSRLPATRRDSLWQCKICLRQCFELVYPSQREKPENRAIHQADKIRDKLNWKPGIANGRGSKPKGMHCRTFERLTAHHDAFVQTALTGMAMRFNILEGPFDDMP